MSTVMLPGLENIYWLGGSPCCGKSSVAEQLRDRYGIHYYKCDDHFDAHLAVGAERGLPVCSVLKGANHEYVFMRSHEENVRLAFDIFREEFDLVLEDITALSRPLLVEGCALLPDRMASLEMPRDRVFYMVPEESFYRQQYAKRAWAWDRLEETSDPDRAFENWMKRDVTFAQHVAASAKANGFPCLWVDGTVSLADTAKRVTEHYGLSDREHSA